MNIKKQLNSQDLSDLVHVYDELKDVEYITNKPYNDVTLRDIMTMRLKLRETIGCLDKILRETEEKPHVDIRNNPKFTDDPFGLNSLLKAFLGNNGDDEEECTCDLVKELIDENEHLKNQVYNLTLYLQSAQAIMNPMGWDLLKVRYSGLPGYCPEEE